MRESHHRMSSPTFVFQKFCSASFADATWSEDSGSWRSTDHCLLRPHRDHRLLPGILHHGWPWASRGSVRHEGLHGVCRAGQLRRRLPQLPGQGRGPGGPQKQIGGRVGQRPPGHDGALPALSTCLRRGLKLQDRARVREDEREDARSKQTSKFT